MSKVKVNTGWLLKKWQVISAISGIIIYTIGLLITVIVWKTNIERDIKDKIDEAKARFLIQLEISDMKTDVRDIKNFLMKK